MSSPKTDKRALSMSSMADRAPDVVDVSRASSKEESSDRQESDVRAKNNDKKSICVEENQNPAAAKKKESKGSSDDDAKSKTKAVVSQAAAFLPGVDYVDSEVVRGGRKEEQSSNAAKKLAPRAEERSSSEANKLAPRAEGEEGSSSDLMKYISKRNERSTSDEDDAMVGAGIEAVSSSTNTNPTRPGAVQVQLGKTSIKELDPSSSEEFFYSSPMRIPSVTTDTALVTHQEEDPEAETDDGEETLHILVATKVESQWNLVTAVAAKDDGLKSCCLKVDNNRKGKMLVIGAFCLVLVMVVVVVGLTVAFAAGGTITEKDVTQDTFFDTIGGGPIDGTVRDGKYGVSVATNRDGSRIAVADLFGVHVYELLEGDSNSNWEMLGSNIQGDATNNATAFPDSASSEYLKALIRAPILTTMSMDGSVVAIAWPFHDEEDAGNTTNIGLVEVYLYVKESLSWERKGNSILGNFSGDFFGSSLSLSEDGSSLAVGAAGNGGYAEVYLFNSGSWNQLGGTVVTASEERLGIFSISLSNDGTILAVAGMPASKEDGAVAKVFHLVSNEWEERGSGIVGQTAIGGTIYLAHISGDGDTIVVSNYFTTAAKENTGEGLDVRAFKWSVDTNDWEPLGEEMHAGNMAEKSGYFVSLSEDGRTIAMGDPGARVEGQGAVSGHAHFFVFKDGEWIPLGPTYEGEAAGDQFGYAVALSGNGEYLVAGAPYNRAMGKERGRVVVLKAAA
jgi:hypothetical protein